MNIRFTTKAVNTQSHVRDKIIGFFMNNVYYTHVFPIYLLLLFFKSHICESCAVYVIIIISCIHKRKFTADVFFFIFLYLLLLHYLFKPATCKHLSHGLKNIHKKVTWLISMIILMLYRGRCCCGQDICKVSRQ